MKKHLLILSLSLLTLAFSCKKKETETEPKPEQKPFPEETFNYTGKMEVTDFKVYKGSGEGGKEVSVNYTPESIWEGRVKNFTPPAKLVFKSKDTLALLPNKVESDMIRYQFSGDTIKCHNRYNNSWEVYGIKTKTRIEYKMTFYMFVRSTPPYATAAAGTEHGVTLFKNVFISNAPNFASPAHMTNANDLMGWYNVSFIYELKTSS